MPDFRLPTPTARVRMSDGRVLEARVLNTDYLRWDRTRSKHNWPPAAEALFMYMTFLAWSALRREGQIADSLTWEQFSEESCEQVELDRQEAELNGTSGVDPTLEGVGLT